MDSDWQNCSTSKRNAHLLKTGLRSDCYFLVGVVPENKRLFKAHKFVLSSASVVFDRMFYGALAEKDEAIEIHDMEPDDFYCLLLFMYTEEVEEFASIDKAQQLYYASNKYMLDVLMERCIDFLKLNVTPDNAIQIMEFASLFEETSLEEKCMEIIKTKTSTVLKSPSLLLVNISSLEKILDLDNLCISNELEIFNALERYSEFRFLIDKRPDPTCETCENQEPSTPLPAEDSDSENECSKNALKENECPKSENGHKLYNKSFEKKEEIAKFMKLIKKIRFLTLTPKEFISGPAFSKLLNERCALDILACLENPEIIPSRFPKGFCGIKKKRV